MPCKNDVEQVSTDQNQTVQAIRRSLVEKMSLPDRSGKFIVIHSGSFFLASPTEIIFSSSLGLKL